MIDEQNEPLEQEDQNKTPKKVSPYTIAVFCITLVHTILMITFYEPASVGVDTHGYTVQSKVIAEQGRVWYPLESDLQFYGDHWIHIEDDKLISRYPPGFPILGAVIYQLFGNNGVFLINPILTSLILPGLYLLCCIWMSPMLACSAVLIMAVNPVANSWSFMGDSHILLAFCLVWGLYCIARWTKNYSIPMAAIGGFLLGWLPTIHYAEAIYALSIAAYMLMYAANTRQYWVSLIVAVTAASIPLVIMAVHNYLEFGLFTINGYTTNTSVMLFSLFGMGKIFWYIGNLHLIGLGWFATVGFIGFITLCQIKETRREGILLAGISVSALLLYSAYFFLDQTQRFLLPTFYLYVVAGMWVFHILFQKKFSGIKVVLITMIVVSTIWGIFSTGMQIAHIHQRNELMANAARTVHDVITEESPLVIAPKNLGTHLLFVSDYRMVDEAFFTGNSIHPFPSSSREDNSNVPPSEGVRGPGGLFQWDQKIKLLDLYKNDGPELSSTLLDELDRWMGDKNTLYWIGEKDKVLPKIPFSDSVALVGTFPLDLSMGTPFRGGRPGPPGPGRNNTEETNSREPEQQDTMFRRPEGQPGSNPGGAPGGPGMNRGPGGPRGRPPKLNPTTISIYQWTRNP